MSSPRYSRIAVTGDDAADFLQGQLTNDVSKLADGDEQIAAWCNPKGRVIVILRVTRTPDGFDLVLPAELAAAVAQRLTMFRFRSRVQFETGPAEPPAAIEGLAYIGNAQSEKYTPHMLNLDLLGGVDFDKGCYTGQEVVARTHFRGATRRRAHRFTANAGLAVGDKVSDGERDVGEVLNVDGEQLLAVVPVDAVDKRLTVEGTILTYVPLRGA